MNYEVKNNSLKVSITLLNGDISLRGEDRNDISVDFDELRKGTAEEVFDIAFDGEELTVSQKNKKLSQFINKEEFPVLISVPSQLMITGTLDTLKGDISFCGAGSFAGKLASKKGDVSVAGIKEADADINVISGDISVSGSDGKFRVSSISGDVSISEGKMKELKVKSVSGDVCVNCEFELEDDLNINSVTGDVSLNLQTFSGEAGITVNSVSGDISITGEKPAEEKIHISQVKGEFAKFNKAFFQDSLKPMIKNLREHIKDATRHSFRSEVHSSKQDNQNVSQILNMVSEGKITAEEAEKLINALK